MHSSCVACCLSLPSHSPPEGGGLRGWFTGQTTSQCEKLPASQLVASITDLQPLVQTRCPSWSEGEQRYVENRIGMLLFSPLLDQHSFTINIHLIIIDECAIV